MWVGWGIWLEAKNIDRGRGYGIFFEMRLGTMKEVWFTNRFGTMFFTNYDKYSTIR